MQVDAELTRPCSTVVPISLYRKPSTLRDWLKFYKPRTDGFEPSYGPVIAAILYLTLVKQRERLASKVGEWDYTVVVPSTRRELSHPLEDQLRTVGIEEIARPLTRTQTPLGHRIMSDDGYACVTVIRGKKFLLVDDVYTTGARSQSAASALQLAGGRVVAVVVIGRRINVEYNDITERVWNRQESKKFCFDTVFDYLA